MVTGITEMAQSGKIIKIRGALSSRFYFSLLSSRSSPIPGRIINTENERSVPQLTHRHSGAPGMLRTSKFITYFVYLRQLSLGFQINVKCLRAKTQKKK